MGRSTPALHTVAVALSAWLIGAGPEPAGNRCRHAGAYHELRDAAAAIGRWMKFRWCTAIYGVSSKGFKLFLIWFNRVARILIVCHYDLLIVWFSFSQQGKYSKLLANKTTKLDPKNLLKCSYTTRESVIQSDIIKSSMRQKC